MYNPLGIITPDVTRTLGYISMDAQRALGIITPDVTRTLGQRLELPGSILGVPFGTWATVMGMAGVASGAAGFVATRSAKGAILGTLAGALGSAAGIATASYLSNRALEKEFARGGVV